MNSAFGQLFVWLHEKHNARLKPLAEVKQQIINTLNREAKQNHYNETLNKLKKNYRLIIEDGQGNQSSLTLIGLKVAMTRKLTLSVRRFNIQRLFFILILLLPFSLQAHPPPGLLALNETATNQFQEFGSCLKIASTATHASIP